MIPEQMAHPARKKAIPVSTAQKDAAFVCVASECADGRSEATSGWVAGDLEREGGALYDRIPEEWNELATGGKAGCGPGY